MRRLVSAVAIVIVLGLAKSAAGAGPVWIVPLADTINPAVAGFVVRNLHKAASEGASLVIITVDTPGGVAESMRKIVQAILASPVPVVAYVSPAGARAASAGAFVVLAAHLAAMAPATHMGAAAPVGPGGGDIRGTMGKKVLSDLLSLAEALAKRRHRPVEAVKKMVTEAASYEALRAREMGLVDILAPGLGELLKALQGREVTTAAGRVRIDVTGAPLHFAAPTWRDRLLSALANPTLAYILLMIGLAGIYFELSHPGAVLPGVVGATCLILAFFAMSALNVSTAGLALIILAVVLFIAEIKITSYGMLSVAGAICLVLGSIMLFESPEGVPSVPWKVMVPTLVAVVGFFAAVAFLAGKAQLRQSITGAEGLVGQVGVVLRPGMVRVAGELWKASGPGSDQVGQKVVVKKVNGLVVEVEPIREGR